MIKIVNESRQLEYEDDIVIVKDPSGNVIYKGIEDYEPMNREDWKWDGSKYTLPDGHTKEVLENMSEHYYTHQYAPDTQYFVVKDSEVAKEFKSADEMKAYMNEIGANDWISSKGTFMKMFSDGSFRPIIDDQDLTEGLLFKDTGDRYFGGFDPDKKDEGFLIKEDTVQNADGTWSNVGKEGSHGKFKTKKEADDQRKAMFASGWKG